MYRAIARNKRNTVFIILLFLVLIGALGWLASYIYQSYTILVVVVIGAVLYAAVPVLPGEQSGAEHVGGDPDPEGRQSPSLERRRESVDHHRHARCLPSTS